MGVVVVAPADAFKPNRIAPLSYQGIGLDKRASKHPVDVGSVNPPSPIDCFFVAITVTSVVLLV